jgi:hypothetical protein
MHYLRLRKAIGLVGLALPFVLAAGENLRNALVPRAPRPGGGWTELSISAYYHGGLRDVFVGSLVAIGIFLICYNGYQRIDNLAANCAGAAVLVVALCPTWEDPRRPPVRWDSFTLFSGPDFPDPPVIGYLHLAAASVFFVILAAMSLFLFTRSGPTQTREKRQRNRVYVACGIIILASLVAIVAGRLLLGAGFARTTSLLFWAESVAIVAFGVSWLVKGEVILKDSSDLGPAAGVSG